MHGLIVDKFTPPSLFRAIASSDIEAVSQPFSASFVESVQFSQATMPKANQSFSFVFSELLSHLGYAASHHHPEIA